MMNHRILLSLLASFAIASTAVAGQADKTLDIYWMDVEGGGATLIVTPENESVLIDTGNPGGRDSGRINKVASEVAGLKKIDHLIITHFHIDHFGGAGELSKLIPIGMLHDNGVPEHDPDHGPNDAFFLRMIQPYKDMKVESREVIKPDDIIKLRQASDSSVAKLNLRCLAAEQVFTKSISNSVATNAACADVKTKPKDNSDNCNSVVMLLDFGPFRFYDAGDLTWNTEGLLFCPVNPVGQVDVYQVTHHGLDLSNNPLAVRSVNPTVTVMSNGTRKGCEPTTFATLKSTPSIQAMYQIHKNLRNDGSTNNAPDDCIANLEQNCAGNYIKLSVAPDGKSYTVSIPANGHKKTFQTKTAH